MYNIIIHTHHRHMQQRIMLVAAHCISVTFHASSSTTLMLAAALLVQENCRNAFKHSSAYVCSRFPRHKISLALVLSANCSVSQQETQAPKHRQAP